jgi:hypothetical protein
MTETVHAGFAEQQKNTVHADFAEQQKNAAALVGTMLNSGAEPILKAQAEILVSVESTFTDWLHRRHEAVAETQKLVERLRTTSDPSEMLKAQQDWVTGAFRRLAADAAAAQSATMEFVDRSRGWIKQGADAASEIVPHAGEAARAVTKPMRMTKAAE